MHELDVQEKVECNNLLLSLEGKSQEIGLCSHQSNEPLVKQVNEYPINSIAEFTSVVDIDYMVQSIKDNGQYNPILLWYNKATRRQELVDGRHRMWACNELGIKVDVKLLSDTVTLTDLPAIVLDIQLTQQKVPNKNASSAIIMRYLKEYGNRTTVTMKSMRELYPHIMLTKPDMASMNYLLDKEPLWFKALELGQGVSVEGTYTKLTSPRALQKVSKERYEALRTSGRVVETTTTDPELALAFKKVRALISSLDMDSKMAYALQQESSKLVAQHPSIEVEDYPQIPTDQQGGLA